MGRKFASPQRYLRPDPRFGSKLVTKIVNALMLEGQKTVAQRVFYRAMDIVAERIGDREPVEILNQAIENIKPRIEVRSKRVGGATYQVPIEVKRTRQQTLAIRWLLEVVRKKKGRPMSDRIADEVCGAFRGEGEAVTKRDNVHKMAEANRAFAHFAW
jgi:small subunit ribosomal protein S7